MLKARPFLMFDGRAEEAMTCYVSLFRDAEVLKLKRFDGGTGVESGLFRVGDLEIMTFDSPVKHAFGFTPAISLFVNMDSPDDIDACFAQLSESGNVLMGLDAYPFSPKFGWVQDRFGVSWQLSLTRKE